MIWQLQMVTMRCFSAKHPPIGLKKAKEVLMSRCRVQKVKVKDLFSFNRGKNLGRAFHASFSQDEDNQYTELECKIGISPADVAPWLPDTESWDVAARVPIGPIFEQM